MSENFSRWNDPHQLPVTRYQSPGDEGANAGNYCPGVMGFRFRRRTIHGSHSISCFPTVSKLRSWTFCPQNRHPRVCQWHLPGENKHPKRCHPERSRRISYLDDLFRNCEVSAPPGRDPGRDDIAIVGFVDRFHIFPGLVMLSNHSDAKFLF